MTSPPQTNQMSSPDTRERWPVAFSQIFMPPSRFEPDSFEQAFLADYARRYASNRLAGAILGLLTWTAFLSWDWWHASQNPGFRHQFHQIFMLRGIGIVLLGTTVIFLNFHPRFKKERFASSALIAEVSLAYIILMAMIAILPFPLNYLFYFIGLPLVVVFASGLMRLRAKLVVIFNASAIILGCVGFQFCDVDVYGATFGHISNYYAWSATSFLLSFGIVGYVLAAELERTARDTFARESQLVEAQTNLEIRTQTLLAMKEQLRLRAEEENANKSKFLADAAHDLRQPMQALSNYLEAASHASQAANPGKCSEHIEMAQAALRLTRASFRAILEISQLESGLVQAEYLSFDVQHLLDEALAQCSGLVPAEGIRIRARRRKGPPVIVKSDRHLIGRVLTNLISNAIKYRDLNKGATSAVFVGVVGLPNHARVDVVDNGVGIPRSEWENIFKPFVQINNAARDRERGFGLGLSIINAIIRLLDGHRIEMNSIEGRGTRFSIEIPRSEEPGTTISFAVDSLPARLPDLAGAYVIYVEDDKLVQHSTAALFEAYGILSEIVGTVDELKLRVQDLERPPDVAITDHRLPDGFNARDVVKLLRDEISTSLPIIILTGETLALETEPWYSRDIQVLRKPVSPGILLQKIHDLVNAPI